MCDSLYFTPRPRNQLVKFGESKITVLEDFEAALRRHKPGDTVKVTVRRGDKLIEADVTLARRRGQ